MKPYFLKLILNMESLKEIPPTDCCTLCHKSDDEIELIEIESNSLKYGEEIIEFGDLLFDVLQCKVSNLK